MVVLPMPTPIHPSLHPTCVGPTPYPPYVSPRYVGGRFVWGYIRGLLLTIIFLQIFPDQNLKFLWRYFSIQNHISEKFFYRIFTFSMGVPLYI